MICRLNGINFADLPHIRCQWIDPDMHELMPSGALSKRSGEECTIIREEGKLWDTEGNPAYSVRFGGYHVGYIPLVTTLKEEALKARVGVLKVWKAGFENMTKEQLRDYAKACHDQGDLTCFHDWEDVGISDETKKVASSKMRECETVEMVRDWLYCEIMRNHLTPKGTLLPLYYDEVAGRNYNEIGEICSISVALDDFFE